MKNTKSKIIVVMCVALLMMVIGYGAFSTMITITGTANIASEWNVVFTNIEQISKSSGVTEKVTPVASGTTATFSVGLSSPGDKVEYKITVENKGTIDAIIENIKATEAGNEAIIFSISNIKIGDVLEGKTTTTFNVSIEYNSSITTQPENLTNSLTISIDYVQYVGQTITPSEPEIERPILLSTAIFRDNIAYADNVASTYVTSSTGIDFSAISSDTNGKGLYYTSTNTEGNLPTYYFRGAVENNYVQFGIYSSDVYYGYYSDTSSLFSVYDSLSTCESATIYNINCTKVISAGAPIYWRIVRINEDGSIRLIYNGSSTIGEYVSIGNNKFNASANDNVYVGYMYGTAGSDTYELTHANTNNSILKNVLDNWYNEDTNLLNLNVSHLTDAGFCNDRSVAPSAGLWYSQDTALGYAKNYTVYGAAGRLVNIGTWVTTTKENAQPQFKCPNESMDLFTTSSYTKGNNKLANPVGLITMDEAVYAGGVIYESNESMYLSGKSTWTMSPFFFRGQYASMGAISGDGKVHELNSNNGSDNGYGVRPVINLKSTVEIADGDGKLNTPYIIK